MPAHPGLTVDEAQAILAYVMNIKSTAINATPLAGTYAPTGGATAGQVIFRAVYTDKGVAGPTPLLSHTVERVAVRRSPVVRAVAADQSQGMTLAAILEMSAAMQALCHTTADHKEAVTAFLEKRKPVFTGR